MNKAEFVAAVAEKAEVSKANAAKVVDAVLAVIPETLAAGDEVRLVGFGTFSVTEIAERKGTLSFADKEGQTWTSPAHKAPKFKAGKPFKDAIA